MAKTVLFSISANSNPRKLFTVQERTSGDLTLIVKHTEFAGTGQQDHRRIVNEHFSIHRTPSSPRLNAIKHSKVLKDGSVGVTRNFTSALKENGRFAVVFIRRAGSMINSRYDLSGNEKTVVSLDRYDPEFFQPIYAILISTPVKTFGLPPIGMNKREYAFTHFNLAVLWRYMALPGGDTVDDATPKTFSDDELQDAAPHERESKARMANGEDRDGAINFFRQISEELAFNYGKAEGEALDIISSEWLTYRASIGISMCLKSGKAFSPEHKTLARKLQVRRALLEARGII